VKPRYPVYVPSRGRSHNPLTVKFLQKDKVPFYLVVEPQEEEAYRIATGHDDILVLPWSNLGRGGLIAVRNWIRDHSQNAGHERHWQLDDNIRVLMRIWGGKRVRAAAGPILRAAEDFVDRYENVAVAGLNYETFHRQRNRPPFTLNAHVYSCTLFLNRIPYRWRLDYNDDTDMCLQALSGGWCTVLFNALMCQKRATMTIKGGNSPIYEGDGRLKMSRSLERMWPGVVETKRRFQRPQHVITAAWQKFDTPLIRKPGLVIDESPNEYGMELTSVEPIRSGVVRGLLDDWQTQTADQPSNNHE
jgi:hypothetical protein